MENGWHHLLSTWRAPIDLATGEKRNNRERLVGVSVHTSANFGKKINVLVLLNLQDSRFSEEEEEERNMTQN